MTKALFLAALVSLCAATAHAAPAQVAAVGDDSTCKVGCWASNTPSANADVKVASGLSSLGLAKADNRIA